MEETRHLKDLEFKRIEMEKCARIQEEKERKALERERMLEREREKVFYFRVSVFLGVGFVAGAYFMKSRIR